MQEGRVRMAVASRIPAALRVGADGATQARAQVGDLSEEGLVALLELLEAGVESENWF